MEVRESTSLDPKASGLLSCDFSFSISEVVTPPFDKSLESQLSTSGVTPYKKNYGLDEDAFDDVDGSEKFLAVVSIDQKLKGYIIASKSWNAMASIDDIAVDASIRGSGAAKRLIQLTQDWAKRENTAGLRAETQSNNVQACHLYRSCGFKFGGYDEYLYKGIPEHSHETALFWYLLFNA